MLRSSGKGRRRGEATWQKENAAPHPHDAFTNQEMRIAGFTSSFKKRYYGGKYCKANTSCLFPLIRSFDSFMFFLFSELVRHIRRHPVAKRTPRVPVLLPLDINATGDVSATKKANEEINNDGAVFAMNGSSPDGSSGITEAKAVQGQTFLEIKGTEDTDISQSQQHLKRRRIQQSMGEGQTSKVEPGTTMVAEEEGHNLSDYERLAQLFSPGIF